VISDSQSFWSYRNYFWLWLSLSILIVLSLIYFLFVPATGHSGDSFLGYFLGVLATLAIFYLMWFGIRKRSYYTSQGSLKSWLAAHVWIGISLLFVVPLHAGFELSWNVHSIAYYVMVIVVLSGIWGAINYKNLASKISANRGGVQSKELLQEISRLDNQLKELKQNEKIKDFTDKIDFHFDPGSFLRIFYFKPENFSVGSIKTELSLLSETETKNAFDVLKLLSLKRDLVGRWYSDLRISFLLKFWLLIHVPLSFCLILLVLLHIVLVFYYR